MVRPGIEEVEAYCRERGNEVDAEQWMNHYEAVGWKIGKSPMKDWRAAVRTWERRSRVSGKCLKHPHSGLTPMGRCWTCYAGEE